MRTKEAPPFRNAVDMTKMCGEWEVPVTRNAKITPVNEGGGGAGSGSLPSGITFGRVPRYPVTLRLIHPPPKMTQGVMTP
jgi:hypothetical protein